MDKFIARLPKIQDPYVLDYCFLVGAGSSIVGGLALLSGVLFSKYWPAVTVILFMFMGVFFLSLWLYGSFVIRRT